MAEGAKQEIAIRAAEEHLWTLTAEVVPEASKVQAQVNAIGDLRDKQRWLYLDAILQASRAAKKAGQVTTSSWMWPVGHPHARAVLAEAADAVLVYCVIASGLESVPGLLQKHDLVVQDAARRLPFGVSTRLAVSAIQNCADRQEDGCWSTAFNRDEQEVPWNESPDSAAAACSATFPATATIGST